MLDEVLVYSYFLNRVDVDLGQSKDCRSQTNLKNVVARVALSRFRPIKFVHRFGVGSHA